MPSLLSPSEPAPFELVNATGQSDVVLLCDHACNRIPLQLHALGLGAQELNSHIALDLGALQVARHLSTCLDAPLVASNYSRLVIDCNRYPESGDCIPVSSAGIVIPGNQDLAAGEIHRRHQTLFEPYHTAIDDLLEARADRTALLLSIHSFTPELQGIKRPWPIGVCYADEKFLARRWLDALQAQIGDPVGDNEPYSIELDIDYSLPVHGQKHGIPVIMLEIKQNEISSLADAKKWAETIATAWCITEGYTNY